MRRPSGFRKARARAARGSLREKDLAWTESQTIHQRINRQASRVAPQTGPAQHLGSDGPCRLLEVCGAAKNRRREAWVVRAQRKQFLSAAGTGQAERGGVEDRQEVTRARAPGIPSVGGQSIAHRTWCQITAPALRRGVPRCLSCRADKASPPADGALISESVLATSEQGRTGLERPGKGEWPLSPMRRRRYKRRRSPP